MLLIAFTLVGGLAFLILMGHVDEVATLRDWEIALTPDGQGVFARVAQQVRAAWVDAYAAEPFVHVLPEGRWPRTADTLGANTVLVQVAVDARVGRVVAVAAADNLTKGTAGGAVQSANLALDLPETLGLPVAGLAP